MTKLQHKGGDGPKTNRGKVVITPERIDLEQKLKLPETDIFKRVNLYSSDPEKSRHGGRNRVKTDCESGVLTL